MNADLNNSQTLFSNTEFLEDMAYVNRNAINAEGIRSKFISDGEYLFDPYPYKKNTACERCGGEINKRLLSMNITHCEECL